MLMMARRQILPAVLAYAGRLAEIAGQVRNLGVRLNCAGSTLSSYCAKCDLLNDAVNTLSHTLAVRPAEEDPEAAARYMRDQVLPAMKQLRKTADDLEQVTDQKLWPFPAYDQLLFNV